MSGRVCWAGRRHSSSVVHFPLSVSLWERQRSEQRIGEKGIDEDIWNRYLSAGTGRAREGTYPRRVTRRVTTSYARTYARSCTRHIQGPFDLCMLVHANHSFPYRVFVVLQSPHSQQSAPSGAIVAIPRVLG